MTKSQQIAFLANAQNLLMQAHALLEREGYVAADDVKTAIDAVQVEIDRANGEMYVA